MYIYKSYLDNYIKCPHYFALCLLNKSVDKSVTDQSVADILKKATKSKTYKVLNKSHIKRDIHWIKDSISKIALQEMTSGEKCGIHEYRIMYTNKYFKNILATHKDAKSAELIERLNDAFSIFASNVFLGYDVPIEIPILKTNIVYRDVIDFILCDVNDQEKITIVEFDDLSSKVQIRKYREWAHYKIQYYFIADSLKSNVNVIIMDPINTNNRLEFTYKPRRFNEVHDACSKIVLDVANPVIFKNLNSCSTCEYLEMCFSEEENVRE